MAEQYNHGDKGQTKKARQLERILRERFHNGIAKMCNDRDIRYVLASFLSEFGAFRDDPQIPTPDFMFEHGRASGRRSAGLWLMQQLLLCDPAIMSKLQQDDDSPLKKEEPHDDRDDDDGNHGDDGTSG